MTKKRKKYPTILRYPGGKSRIAWYLFDQEMLPENITEYREGFLGGGSCALTFSTMYPDIPVWVNDLFYELYCFWTQLQADPKRLHAAAHEVKDNCGDTLEDHKKEYLRIKDLFDNPGDDFDRALSFYVLNRMSFGGMIGRGSNFTGDSFRGKIFDRQKIDNLLSVAEIIKNWKITNTDYRELMLTPGKERGVFVFLDPPYKIKDMLYGKSGDMHKTFSHEDFAEACWECSHNIQITYNDDPSLRELFDGMIMETFEFTYSLAHRPDSDKNKKEELLILNYTPQRDRRGVLPF